MHYQKPAPGAGCVLFPILLLPEIRPVAARLIVYSKFTTGFKHDYVTDGNEVADKPAFS